MPRIYPHPDLGDKAGIPVAGEIYTEEDAKRLVGAGLAVRRPPAKTAPRPKRSKTPAPPVKEG